MAYTPQTWHDLDPLTPLDAARLTYIENGVQTNAANIDTVNSTIGTALTPTTPYAVLQVNSGATQYVEGKVTANNLDPTFAGSVGGTPLFVRRTGDSTARNSGNTGATLTNDDTLFFSVGANDIWWVEGYMIYNGANTTMDIKFGWSVPTAATMSWGTLSLSGNTIGGWGGSSTANTPLTIKSASATVSYGTSAGLSNGGSFAGMYIGGGTSGTLTLQWSQDVSDAGNLSLLTNSFLRATRLA